jgi:vesicle-associated membrane protein 7
VILKGIPATKNIPPIKRISNSILGNIIKLCTKITMTIEYIAITDGTKVISAGTKDQKIIDAVGQVFEKLQNMLSDGNRRIIEATKYKFYTMKESGELYCCVSDGKEKTRTCYALLNEAYERRNDPKLKNVLVQLLKKYNDPRADKIQALEVQMEDIKDIVIQNIDKVLDRGEKLESMVDTTEEMEQSAQGFRRGAGRLKRSQGYRMIILIFILIFVILAICAIIAVIIWIAVSSSK